MMTCCHSGRPSTSVAQIHHVALLPSWETARTARDVRRVAGCRGGSRPLLAAAVDPCRRRETRCPLACQSPPGPSNGRRPPAARHWDTKLAQSLSAEDQNVRVRGREPTCRRRRRRPRGRRSRRSRRRLDPASMKPEGDQAEDEERRARSGGGARRASDRVRGRRAHDASSTVAVDGAGLGRPPGIADRRVVRVATAAPHSALGSAAGNATVKAVPTPDGAGYA